MFFALEDTTIRETSTIALSAAGGVLLTAVTTTWKLSAAMNKLREAITSLEHRFELKEARDGATVRKSEMIAWVKLARERVKELPPFPIESEES